MRKTTLYDKTKTVSAIVPVFDEEQNIEKIISFLLKNPLINEIIAVNDGSTDNSLNILNTFKPKIKVISYKKNHGKGYALAEGIKKAKSEIVFFLDADLINFTEKHVSKILFPLFSGEKKAVLGCGTPSKNHIIASRGLIKSITGQRAYFKNDLLPHIKKMAKTRYGVEIYLSSLFGRKETKMIPLVGVTHIWKHKKHKPQKAIRQYIKMGTEIASEIGKRELREQLPAINKITKFTDLKSKSTIFLPVGKIQGYYKKIAGNSILIMFITFFRRTIF